MCLKYDSASLEKDEIGESDVDLSFNFSNICLVAMS